MHRWRKNFKIKVGVCGLIKKDIPNLLSIHYLAHKFSLASKTDLNDNYPISNELYQLVYDTYKYFDGSYRRLNQLFESEEEIEELTWYLNLEKPISIRWLTLFKSISRVGKILKSIILSLKEMKDLTSKTLLCYFADPSF